MKHEKHQFNLAEGFTYNTCQLLCMLGELKKNVRFCENKNQYILLLHYIFPNLYTIAK